MLDVLHYNENESNNVVVGKKQQKTSFHHKSRVLINDDDDDTENNDTKNAARRRWGNDATKEVLTDEDEDGDKENRDPNVPTRSRQGNNDEVEQLSQSMMMNIRKEKEESRTFQTNKQTTKNRRNFVAKLYSPYGPVETKRTQLSDVTRSFSPNRLLPGKTLICKGKFASSSSTMTMKTMRLNKDSQSILTRKRKHTTSVLNFRRYFVVALL